MAISADLERELVAKRILKGLHKVVPYRKASIQLIHGDTRTLLAHQGFGSRTSINGY